MLEARTSLILTTSLRCFESGEELDTVGRGREEGTEDGKRRRGVRG